MNVEELIRDYGTEFLQESDYYDQMPYEMDMLEEITNYTPLEAITRDFYGYQWSGVEKENPAEFNPNDEYFAFNGYGNLVSIPEYCYEEYLKSQIDEDEFIEWCKEQGYVDEDEDIEGCKGIGGSRDRFVIAKVYNTRYRNTSYYGNPSYYVTLELENGELWHCYTAPDVSLGYEIENSYMKNEWHKFMYRDGARGCALHWAEKI